MFALFCEQQIKSDIHVRYQNETYSNKYAVKYLFMLGNLSFYMQTGDKRQVTNGNAELQCQFGSIHIPTSEANKDITLHALVCFTLIELLVC